MSLPINGGSVYASPKDIEEEKTSTIQQPSFEIPDHDVSFTENDKHPGDYSTRMEELFDDGGDDEEFEEKEGNNENDDDEGFLYTGIDAADVPAGYKEQLRDVLGSELSDDDQLEAYEVERSLIIDDTTGVRSNGNQPLVSSRKCAVAVILIFIFCLGVWRRSFRPYSFDVINRTTNTSEDDFPRRSWDVLEDCSAISTSNRLQTTILPTLVTTF